MRNSHLAGVVSFLSTNFLLERNGKTKPTKFSNNLAKLQLSQGVPAVSRIWSFARTHATLALLGDRWHDARCLAKQWWAPRPSLVMSAPSRRSEAAAPLKLRVPWTRRARLRRASRAA